MNLVLQHIGRNFTRELSEAELAELGRQSVSTFSRSFRKHTGMTFVQYVNSLRIELACQHLGQAELTVTEICYEVGFRNVSNFNRQFLAVKGMPPSRFRSLQRRAAPRRRGLTARLPQTERRSAAPAERRQPTRGNAMIHPVHATTARAAGLAAGCSAERRMPRRSPTRPSRS